MGKGTNIIVTALLGIALLALAGCGGGGDSETLTKSEFVRKANTACGELQREREEVISAFNEKFEAEGIPSKDEQTQALLEMVEAYEGATAKIAELNPPEADQEEVESIVADMEEASEKAREDPIGTIKNSRVFQKPDKSAAAYGIDECQL